MGAGKTTVGRKLAATLGLDFLDCDHEIEARTGADIPLIFEKEGEAGFREREQRMIDELSQRDGIVLATGGGAVLDQQNRNRLAARGYVIYLYTSVAQQLTRTRGDRKRPLLQTPDREARLKALFVERDPLYRETADMVVETDGLTSARLCRHLLESLPARAG